MQGPPAKPQPQTAQGPLAWSLIRSTPVGFEPTRGDPIGLAGRRLNRSAKVSLAVQISSAYCEWRQLSTQLADLQREQLALPPNANRLIGRGRNLVLQHSTEL